MTSENPRLLIYSQDGLGLGHLRRTTLLAAEYLAADPAASVLTISDSPLGQFFTASPGHDFVKLPSIRKMSPGNWSPVRLPLEFSDVLAMRAEIIKTTALAFEPDVLLVDHMPHGAMGELVPTLQALDTRPVRTVLGLRDILDSPETIRRRWMVEGAYEVLDRHFDDVFVYGSKDVFDIGGQYSWEPDLRSRISYCGYVCSPPSPQPVKPIRHRYRCDDDAELIVAMAGGGADAYPLFDTLLDAMPALMEERDCHVVIVTGPFMPPEQQEDLRERARGLPVHVVPSVQDSLSHLAAADLIVAMGGYNTTAEILSVGRPALLVPRPGPSAEQVMRVSRFAERGWLHWLPPEELSAPALAASMVDALTSPLEAVGSPDLGGRVRAAELLHEQVEFAVLPASGGG
jgi:predicted glycosyltransferase